MCEIAFMVNNKGEDPLKHYRRGDPVEVLENGADWGTEVDKRAYIAKYGSDVGWKNIFVIMQITDLSVQQAKVYLESNFRDATAVDSEFTAPDPADRFVQVARRVWGLFIDELPAVFRNQLINDGYTQMDTVQARAYFQHKIDRTPITNG